MAMTIAVVIGLAVVGLLVVLALFHFGLSRPVNELQDPSQPRYQYFSERTRRTGRWKQKK
jgi:hypothetical protein